MEETLAAGYDAFTAHLRKGEVRGDSWWNLASIGKTPTLPLYSWSAMGWSMPFMLLWMLVIVGTLPLLFYIVEVCCCL